MEQPINFSTVYADHKEKVRRLVSRYVSTKHDRDDVFQEVFLRVYQGLKGFKGESGIETWIYRVTANTAINYLKKQKRYVALKEVLNKFRFVEEDGRDQDGDREELFKPLNKLNPQQRMVLVLSDVEEQKIADISLALRIPEGTVKSNLHRAREIIKKELSKNDRLQ